MYQILNLLIVILLWNPTYSFTQNIQPLNTNYTTDTQHVAPGLTYMRFQSDSLEGRPLSIHVLKVVLDSIRVEMALAMDQVTGQETTSHIVARKGALAGINGGFSFSNWPWNIYHGDPRDFFMLSGEILSEPYLTRASFGVYTDSTGGQHPLLDQIQWSGHVHKANLHKLTLSGINRARSEDELILYTAQWGVSTLTSPDGYELIVSEGRILAEGKGSSLIPDDGYVLSASGRQIDSLKAINDLNGDITLTHGYQSLLESRSTPVIEGTSYATAGPILIREGQPVTDHTSEQIREDFITTRHPRTAIGIGENHDMLYLIVVDGRQPQLSVGMSLPELTSFLLKLGAYQGYNLDGGGSSTMVVRDAIKNSPSDERERRRCDAVILFPKS